MSTAKKTAAYDHTSRVHPEAQMSFGHSMMHALHGVKHVLMHERNARIHLWTAVLALLLGVVLRVKDTELAAVLFAVVIVFLAEIFNTAIERTLDLIDIKENPRIKTIKDMAAGGVLLASLAAACIGFAIYMPYLIRVLEAIWGS